MKRVNTLTLEMLGLSEGGATLENIELAVRELSARAETAEEHLAECQRDAQVEKALRVAAGVGPYVPIEQVMASVTACRQERDGIRRALRLTPDSAEMVVRDEIGRLQQRAQLGSENGSRVRSVLNMHAASPLDEVLAEIDRLKMKAQHEAGPSNGEWLAQAWETICASLDLPPGASLGDALLAIDELKLRTASSDRLQELESWNQKLSGQYDGLLMTLGLSSGTRIDDVVQRIHELQSAQERVQTLEPEAELLIERAETVSHLITALTAANARMAVSLTEFTG